MFAQWIIVALIFAATAGVFAYFYPEIKKDMAPKIEPLIELTTMSMIELDEM